MSANYKACITCDLSRVSADQREERVERARNNIALQPDSSLFFNRLTQIIELPLEQPIPPLFGGMAAVQGGHAYGVNVHDSHRESATTKAMNLLLEHQKGIDVSILQDAYVRFQAEFDTLPDGDRKKNMKRVLGTGGERHANDFGGLLTGTITTCGAPNMDPKEFLGRLWYFAEAFTDSTSSAEDVERDRENAKQSLFTGLADSIEDGGQVVCNPGKLQRMMIGVLQSRLEGVNIDGEGVVPSAALTDVMKATLDASVFEALKEEGVINPDKVVRVSGVTATGAKDYIAARTITITSLGMNDVLSQSYINREALNTATVSFLENNMEVANDPLLKGAFDYKMEQQFKISINTIFDEFVDRFEKDGRQAKTRSAFAQAVRSYLSDHQEIDAAEFQKLASAHDLD